MSKHRTYVLTDSRRLWLRWLLMRSVILIQMLFLLLLFFANLIQGASVQNRSAG